ncbi:Kelch repeat-containing protein [Acetivibrio clariflavus]|uniref:RHS repeat-associated core domain protein n=1 Tax=Acetivibrio clariflavus (strain DSM 19732 / NBRC 101661 / EBR45) TaxID=720554 RepID=G8M231_ACECE|nr:kelch repeat-containing protein [Acetivibrio clariflavus]AEV68149.1 RHS repeat-associated core domain protein [Acetivibrio clariflavus DSM 19732]
MQEVYFGDPTYSKFNILQITKPLDYGYTFNVQPVWNQLEEVFAASTPAAGTTVTLNELNPARKELAMAEVSSKIYVFGGCTEEGEYLDTVAEYDPLTNKWTESEKTIQTGKSDMAIAATDSEIYIIGGFDGENYLNTVEVYNPAVGEFVKQNIEPMPTARRGAKAVYIDGNIYVMGGYNQDGYLNIVEVYNIQSNTWTTVEKNNDEDYWMEARTGLAIATFGGNIYVFGGYNENGNLSTIEKYDPTTNKWTKLTTTLKVARRDLGALTMSGKIYVFGGRNDGALSIVEEFNPENNAIKQMQHLGTSRSAFGAAVAYNRVYIVGGANGDKVLNTVEEYFTQAIPGLKYLGTLNGLKGNSHLYDVNGVNKITGNYVTQSQDFFIESPAIDLEITRTYNSADADSKDSRVAGGGWIFNFETSIRVLDEGSTYKVTATSLNLRKEPANLEKLTYTDPMQWTIIDNLANGSSVTLAGMQLKVGGRTWYKVVTSENVVGWVCASYLKSVKGIEVTYGSGSKVIFEPDNKGGYVSPPGIYDELTKSGNTVYLTTKDKITYEYDYSTGKLKYIRDRYGNKIKFYYEGGKLRKIYDCDPSNENVEIGRTLTLNYNADGKLECITDNAGRKVSYAYNTQGKLETVTDLNNNKTKYYYYGPNESIAAQSNKLKTIAQINGNTEIKLLTNIYDGTGRVYKQFDNSGRPTYYLYNDIIGDENSPNSADSSEVSRKIIDKKGNTSEEIYNVNFSDRPVKEIDNLGRETHYKYIITYTDGNATASYDITNLTYKDINSNLNDHEHKAYRSMRSNNLPLKTEIIQVAGKDGNKVYGNTSVIEKDAKGNVVYIKNADGTEKRYVYYDNGDLEYEIDENNQQTYYYYEQYDSTGKSRLKMVIKPLEKGVVYTRSNRDQLLGKDLDPVDAAVTIYQYKDTGTKILGCLVEKIIYPEKTTQTFEYRTDGVLLSSTDGENKTTTYDYDNCFRVKSETSPLGYTTEYEYNGNNQVTKVVNKDVDGSNSSISRTTYDYAGRVKKEINVLMYDASKDSGQDYTGNASTEYEYDTYGRVTVKTTNVLNQDKTLSKYTTKYYYDAEGNLEREEKPSGAIYIYNYDSVNRLTAMYFKKDSKSDAVLLEEYFYKDGVKIAENNYGLIKTVRKYLNNKEYADTEYLYDNMGRLVKVTNPEDYQGNRTFTATAYYKDGKVKSVTDARGNSTLYTYGKYENGRTYDEVFTPVTEQNGTVKYSYSKTIYDKNGRKVLEITYSDLVEVIEEDGTYSIKGNAPQKCSVVEYNYYKNDLVKSIISYYADMSTIKYSGSNRVDYRYDDDGNLIEEKTTFDSGKQTIKVYLDYNMYGKPAKIADLIKKDDLDKDIYNAEEEPIVTYTSLFEQNSDGTCDFGPYSDYSDYFAIVTKYSNFDKAGNPGTVTSPNTQTVTYYYDSLGRVGKQIVIDKNVTDINGSGFITSVETITTYNWEGKVIGTSVYANNETGRKLLLSEQNQYNSRGLLEKTIQKGITTKVFNRNTNEETVKTQDLTTAYEYDLAGRLVAEVTPENYVGYKDGEGLLAEGTTNKTEYVYDKQGRLIAKAFRGNIKTYNDYTKEFDEKERYIVIEAYKYDANGNVIKKVDGEAYNKAYENAVTQQKSVAIEAIINDAYGVEYTYNLANQLETIKNPEFTGANGRNYNIKYSYDGLGRIVSETTAYGLNKTLVTEVYGVPVQVSALSYSHTKYLYDDVNRKLDVIVIDNVDNPLYTEYRLRTEYYDYAGNIKKIVDANGNEISYEYNSLGLQRSVTYPGDSSIPANNVVYKYDSMGNLRYQKDSVGNVKEYEYDLFSRITGEKTYGTDDDNANETEVRYLYDLYGNVKYKIDANNTVTKYEYDELGRLTRSVIDNVKVIEPATGVDSTTRTSTHETLNYYDKNGNVLHEVTKVTEKDKSKNTTKSSYSVYSYEYDGMGRLVRKIDPVGNIIEKINYNRNSAQIESYDGEDHKKTFEYNKDGKLSVTKQRNESGEYIVSHQYYDAKGNVAYVIDGRENITVYTYDEQDNLTGVSSYAKVKEGVYKLTDTTRYIYDKNGNMKSQEINGIVTNTLHYNARNLVKEKEYPGNSNNIVSYTYYADGNVKEVIDRKNIKIQYKYNPQGLVVEEKAVQIGSNGKEQSYTKKNYEYDPAGNQLKSILTSSTSTEVVERTYDELGRVKTKAVSNVEGKILYIYDIVTSDGLTAETSIDQKNNITTKVYDKAGRLAFVKNGDINAENIAEYNYYKNGAAKSVIYAGGAREDYIYYPDGRLESLVNKDNSGTEIESYVYTYDENGNMLSKEDKKGITTYTYDNLNRLKTVNEEYSGRITEYTYDKLGNRSTATIKENGIIIEEVYNYNLELNQLKSVITKKNGVAISTTNYEYDANGNLTSSVTDGEKTTYAYDEFNQLINADGAKYGYNAEGYRVSKNVNGSLTRYIYEYDKVVLEINAAGNQVGRNIYGTNLLMRIADGQSYYYMYNGHADVTALINAATGNIDATYYYDAFGNIVESNGVAKDKNSILYAGYQYDKEIGLYYLNARMYDPKIARFLQEDTYTGDINDPLSLNLYTYCNNNPLIYVDPTGHGPEEHDFYRHLESISNKKLKIQKSSYLTGPLSRLGDGSYYVGFTGGYPIEFVTGRSVTSEERIRLNEKVFGNQRLVDIIFTMRYVSDTEFRRAVDEDNATDWKYEGMIYGAKTYPFTLVDTLTTLNSNKPLRSNSEFAQYRNLFNIVDVLKSDFPHKEPISYQNQQRFYNSVWKTQVGLDMAVNVISLGADLGIEALSSGRTISYLAYELDDAARYVDDVFRYIDDATTSINKGISLPKKSRMVEVDLQLFTRKPRVGNKGVRYIDNVTTSINKGISSSSKTRQYLKVDLQLFAEKGTSSTRPYTKSSLKMGQEMHKAYKADVVDNITKFKEFRLPSGKRIDFIDFETKTIYELKPYNPNGIKTGLKQLEVYLKEVESIYGGGWKTILDTY